VRWLATQAEELGVEIYPGFAADEVLYTEDGAVMGIATKDVGIGKDGEAKNTFARGMELRGRQTLFAEGARGSCSEEVIDKFLLREGKDMQTYGIGLKEVWEIPEANFEDGYIQHSLGWPLKSDTYGGSFLYHMAPNKVLVGMVVGLDYKNPYLSPYNEFQRWKTHPEVRYDTAHFCAFALVLSFQFLIKLILCVMEFVRLCSTLHHTGERASFLKLVRLERRGVSVRPEQDWRETTGDCRSVERGLELVRPGTRGEVERKKPPPPGGVSYLLCSLIKSRV